VGAAELEALARALPPMGQLGLETERRMHGPLAPLQPIFDGDEYVPRKIDPAPVRRRGGAGNAAIVDGARLLHEAPPVEIGGDAPVASTRYLVIVRFELERGSSPGAKERVLTRRSAEAVLVDRVRRTPILGVLAEQPAIAATPDWPTAWPALRAQLADKLSRAANIVIEFD
jgi:hypothetical protein